MSLKLSTLALLSLALPVAGCVGQPQTASRTPDDTLQNGTPEGDHTGPPSGSPRDDVGPVAPDQVPGPGYSGAPEDPPTTPTGGASGPNGAAPGGSAGPGR